MAEKPTLKLSEILASLNANAKTAEDDEDKITGGLEAEGVEDVSKGSVDSDKKDPSQSKSESEATADSVSDAGTKPEDGMANGPAEGEGEVAKDKDAPAASLGDTLKDIAKEASEKHQAALIKEAQIFGQAFADSVLERLYAASEHQKMAELYDNTYTYTLQKLAEGMLPGAPMPGMAPMPQQPMPMPQQMPAMPMAPQAPVVDPNFGTMYPTPVAAPNLPGYVESAPAQPPMPQEMMQENVYPASLPPEAAAPAPEEVYPESLKEEKPQADPNIAAVSKAVSSAASAATEVARAASMLTEAVAGPQQEEQAPEEASPAFNDAYNETANALAGMQPGM